MIAVCAWCEREGAPAVLGEREPLDNPGITHGMCERHEVEWVAAARLSKERRQAQQVTAA